MTGLMLKKKKVAVIGAGAAGLVSARYLRDLGGFSVTVFESTGRVGGTWNYSPKRSEYASIYKSLRCNLPHHVMSFQDNPFPESSRSFVGHAEVLEYLIGYARRNRLMSLIRFNSPVMRVSPVEPGSFSSEWSVETSSNREVFAAVVVANGHYFAPRYPYIAGQNLSSIEISHSHEYRVPDAYRGKRLVLLGAGSSGIDISVELASVASKVYLAHRDHQKVRTRTGVEHVAPIKRLEGSRRVELLDGTILENIDSILLCTGYDYSFPFLDDSAGVHIRDGRVVEQLWRHILYIKSPTLSFVGLPYHVAPWRLCESQSRLIALFLSGQITVSPEMLVTEYKQQLEWMCQAGLPEKYTHKLGDRQWEHRRELASITGGLYPSMSEREVYQDASLARRADPAGYREREYEIWGPGEGQWKVTLDGVNVTGLLDPGG